MRITINAPREDKPGRRFRLYLPVPLSLLGWRFIWKHLPEQSRMYAPIASDLVRALKEYRRKYGSWNLVEVHTADDDTHVRIRI